LSRSSLAASLLVAVLVAGCLSPAPPVEPRYFSPAGPPPAAATASTADGPPLRLRRVRAAPYLRQRMVWRRGVEIGFYDLLRWTESPAHFAQSWLENALFERRGFARTNSATATTLKASLDAFDELLAPTHEAAVALDILLTDPKGGTLIDRSIEVRKPIASDDPTAVAEALGEALAEAADQVGAAVAGALGGRSP
jgi:ABC-type uncharacterized transport system auxiliary subunit